MFSSSWVYLTLVEQFLSLVGLIFMCSYLFFNSVIFHSLQTYVNVFVLMVAIILVLNFCRMFASVFILSVFLIFLCLVVLLFWNAFWWFLSWNYKIEVGALFLFNVVTLLLLLNSGDFLLLYLVLECQSLIIYTLMILSSTKEVITSVEASLKYFIMGGLSSVGLLLGASLLYLLTGTTSFMSLVVLVEDLGSLNIISLAVFLILITFLFKLGVARLHFWSVDVCEASPLVLVLFFLTTPKMPILYLANLVLKMVFMTNLEWFWSLSVFIFSSYMLGNYGGFSQVSLGSLFAYNSTGNLGLVLSCCLVLSPMGFLSSWGFMLVYSLSLVLILGFFSLLFKIEGSALGFKYSYGKLNFFDLKGLDLYFSGLTLGVGFMLCSLIGLRRLSGFFIKFFLLSTLVAENLSFWACFFILFSVLSSFVYLSLIKEIYVGL